MTNSLVRDYFPRLHNSHADPIDECEVPFNRSFTAEPKYDNSVHLILADSLDILTSHDNEAMSAQQRAAIKELIIADANKLVAHILPSIVIDQLRIVASPQDNAEFRHPPALRDVYLLAQVYDVTQDVTIKATLEYILNIIPPALSEELAEAYARASERHTLIMDEYQSIVVALDDTLDQIAVSSEDRALGVTTTHPSFPHIKNTPEQELEDTQPRASRATNLSR